MLFLVRKKCFSSQFPDYYLDYTFYKYIKNKKPKQTNKTKPTEISNKLLLNEEWKYFRNLTKSNFFHNENDRIKQIIKQDNSIERITNVCNFLMEFNHDKQIKRNLRTQMNSVLRMRDSFNTKNKKLKIFDEKIDNLPLEDDFIDKCIDIGNFKNLPVIEKYEKINLLLKKSNKR